MGRERHVGAGGCGVPRRARSRAWSREDASQRIAGWTFFLRHGHTLQIGALAASSADVTEALLDAVLASSLAEDATSVVFFGFSTAPGLEALLASRGCDVERYLYLERSTSGIDADLLAASWRDSQRDAVTELLAASYDDSRARAFARDGGIEGWRDYLSQILTEWLRDVFSLRLSDRRRP